MPNRQLGFTLLELSIVLVIIGLLTGAILAGRDLIRAAEIRKIHGEADSIITAIASFKSKYNCLPGDCPNATDFFGMSILCPLPSDHLGTCNGDGNAFLDAPILTVGATSYPYAEGLWAWQQLADAGLLSGSFSGATDPTFLWKAGSNSPAVLSDSVAWVIDDANSQEASQITPIGTMRPGAILFTWAQGNDETLGGGLPGKSLLTPFELQSYDAKYDDGNPVTGRILAEDAYGGGCLTQSAGEYAYDLGSANRDQMNCGPIIYTGF